MHILVLTTRNTLINVLLAVTMEQCRPVLRNTDITAVLIRYLRFPSPGCNSHTPTVGLVALGALPQGTFGLSLSQGTTATTASSTTTKYLR